MRKSLENALNATDIWRKDQQVFKINGTGTNGQNSRCSSRQSQGNLSVSPHRSFEVKQLSSKKGHNPMMTIRDKSVFSVVTGVSQNCGPADILA